MARARDPQRRLDVRSVLGGVGWMLLVSGLAVLLGLVVAALTAAVVRTVGA